MAGRTAAAVSVFIINVGGGTEKITNKENTSGDNIILGEQLIEARQKFQELNTLFWKDYHHKASYIIALCRAIDNHPHHLSQKGIYMGVSKLSVIVFVNASEVLNSYRGVYIPGEWETTISGEFHRCIDVEQYEELEDLQTKISALQQKLCLD